MSDCGRRLVTDVDFETAVCNLSRAIREEGLQAIARLDVRDHFWRHAGHDFRHYLVMEAWSPDLALEALRLCLDVGTILPTTFAVYDLADRETAVTVKEPLSPFASEPEWRRHNPALARVVDEESERVARMPPRGVGAVSGLRRQAEDLATSDQAAKKSPGTERATVRIATIAAGFGLLVSGIAMLALPGPGWLAIAAGLLPGPGWLAIAAGLALLADTGR